MLPATTASRGAQTIASSRAAFAFTARRFWGFVPRQLLPLPQHLPLSPLCSARFVLSWSEVWLGSELESALWFLNRLQSGVERDRTGREGKGTGRVSETEVNKCECKWRKPEPILGHKMFDVYSKTGCDLCVREGVRSRGGEETQHQQSKEDRRASGTAKGRKAEGASINMKWSMRNSK